MTDKKIIVIIWNIWNHMNKIVFENMCPNPSSVLMSSYGLFADFINYKSILNLTKTNIYKVDAAYYRNPLKNYSRILWTMPPKGSQKLNAAASGLKKKIKSWLVELQEITEIMLN